MAALPLIKVSVDAAIATVFREYVERVYREFGVRITGVDIVWGDVSTLQTPGFAVTEVAVNTSA